MKFETVLQLKQRMVGKVPCQLTHFTFTFNLNAANLKQKMYKFDKTRSASDSDVSTSGEINMVATKYSSA